MDDIIRKPKKDITVPRNNLAHRPSMPLVSHPEDSSDGRIEKNPFFEKGPSGRSLMPKEKKTRPYAIVWALVAAVVLGVVFLVANYFSSATIEVSPITRSAHIDHDFVAVSLKSLTDGALTFNFISVPEEKTKEVPATIEKKIQKKASGKVLIFNAYSSEKQRLIKNTRLEDEKTHKIFRIDESVVVPGAKMAGGKVVEPGVVEAIVYADVAGESHNIGLGDFNIPGFKGDPRYSKFTARSKTDSPISGGFSGEIKVPSDEAILGAQEDLKQDLKKNVAEKVRAQVPDGMSLFPGSMVIKFEEVPQESVSGDVSTVTVRATVSVFFFETASLTQKILEASLPEHQGDSLSISNMSALTFSFIDTVEGAVLSDLTKIHFRIEGDVVFVGEINEQKIREALAGKEKKDFGKIIVGQNNVGKAEAVNRPMWKTVFPLDPKKITVKIVGGDD